MPIANRTQALEWCDFQLKWIILSDLSEIFNDMKHRARSVCDSWTSCSRKTRTWSESPCGGVGIVEDDRKDDSDAEADENTDDSERVSPWHLFVGRRLHCRFQHTLTSSGV